MLLGWALILLGNDEACTFACGKVPGEPGRRRGLLPDWEGIKSETLDSFPNPRTSRKSSGINGTKYGIHYVLPPVL